jgi:hypothetical protein
MDKNLERKIIWTLAIILILVGLMGCANPTVNADQPTKKESILSSVGNMGAIGEALGCMFGSSDPICTKKKPQTNILED